MKTNIAIADRKLTVVYVPLAEIQDNGYNPKTISAVGLIDLEKSIVEFGVVDPLILNAAPNRKNILIGGHQRKKIYQKLGYKKVPCVYVNIPDVEREKELCLRLSKNTGDFDFALLAKFDEAFLADIGFSSEELDNVFSEEEVVEQFDLQKELAKLDIKKIEIKKGDVWAIGDSKLMCGDSTVESDMLTLMGDEKADMVLTDPPYILDYLHGKKKKGDAVTGFGAKRDRRYLETDSLPDNFTELWMANVAKVAKSDFHIIIYENWKNIRTIWGEMEKHWKVRNMIVWHLPNRTQGFSAKYKFFSKHDIAMVGSSPAARGMNLKPEEELLQNEYETALYATQGKPAWEGYEKGKRYQPTDFIEYVAADEKSSGQGIIFGTKPLEILIPYIKVLTKRGDLMVEPFGGSGSSMAAAIKMKRRCFTMEKSAVYSEVIRKRVEKLSGVKAVKIHEGKTTTNA
jgi:DNA modification methylase